MTDEVVFLVEEAEEGGFLAKAVGHAIFTDADTLDELRANISEAVECHFEDDERPSTVRLHIVREEVLAL